MNSFLKTFKNDAIAGMVVFLVAVPLSIGVAVGSGVSPFSGLIGAIVGGIVVGLISKSHTSVSGPDAGLSAIIIATISQLGAFEAFLLAVVIAGGIQILMGILRLGLIANYFPSSVIRGLLASIGILFILKWIPHLIGYDKEKKNDFSFFDHFDVNILENISTTLSNFHAGACLIGGLSLITIIAWGRIKFLKNLPIPVALVVIILSTLTNYFDSLFLPSLYLKADHLVNVPVAKSFTHFFTFFTYPDFTKINTTDVWTAGISIALIASLATLLNVEAVDKLDKHSRNTPQSRELIAQGIGNISAGLLGGIPINAAVIRGSLNISSGAETKKATIIHGVLILAFATLLPMILNLIPLSTLAAVLIMSGYKLANPKFLIESYKKGFDQFLPFIVTIIAILATNLLLGIVIGLGLGIIYVLRNDIRSALQITNEKQYNENVARIILPQVASFINKAKMRQLLNAVPANSKIIIDASYTKYIDGDIVEVIRNFKTIMAPEKKIGLSLIGFKNKYSLNDETKHANVMTKELQSILTPQEILAILMEGNKRFVTGSKIEKNTADQMNITASDGQHPLAVVLSCIDSRTATEIIFDLGMGDVFAVRIAGNIVNDDIIASMEFACKIAGAKLIVVLGHTECGAIKGACDNLDLGHLGKLFNKIKPAIEAEYATKQNRNSSNALFVKNVTRLNVHHNIFYIAENSAVLADMINNDEVGIIGAMYDIKTGEVKFTPMYQSKAVMA